jgi:nucleotide-binding universal stress UspA family protein
MIDNSAAAPPSLTAPRAIYDIVVQLTGSSEDEARLAMAAALAEPSGAHIIGVHLHVLPDILDITDPARSAAARTLLEKSDREADTAFGALETRVSALQASHELRRVHGLAPDVGAELTMIARAADLFIGTRPYGDPEGRHRIEEQVLFGSAHACLFLPPGGTPHRRFDTITIAWNNSREAARAIAEAMPFLMRARTVRLVSITSPLDNAKPIEQALEGVMAHLSRHGIKAEASTVPYAGNTGEQIEQLAHQHDADLIVMGAYGHLRLIEFIFGGATRHILRHATLPVLMAH